MGLKKTSILEDVATTASASTEQATPVENGASAAISRLKTTKATTPKPEINKYGGRDFAKEALGKTRCVQFEAALMSPAIAGMQFSTMEQYLALVKQAADAGVAYSFQD